MRMWEADSALLRSFLAMPLMQSRTVSPEIVEWCSEFCSVCDWNWENPSYKFLLSDKWHPVLSVLGRGNKAYANQARTNLFWWQYQITVATNFLAEHAHVNFSTGYIFGSVIAMCWIMIFKRNIVKQMADVCVCNRWSIASTYWVLTVDINFSMRETPGLLLLEPSSDRTSKMMNSKAATSGTVCLWVQWPFSRYNPLSDNRSEPALIISWILLHAYWLTCLHWAYGCAPKTSRRKLSRDVPASCIESTHHGSACISSFAFFRSWPLRSGVEELYNMGST